MVKLEGGDHRPHFGDQTAVVHTETKQQFLRGCSGSFDPVRAVHHNTPLLVDDQRCSGTVHGFDDHTAVALTTQLRYHSIVVDGGWTNKAHELVFNPDVDGPARHFTPPLIERCRSLLMKSPQARARDATPG